MADIVVTQDELALRRRARRRLVGAVAIALTSVVVLPMLFDSEPKPLGPEVDIRIPAQNTPFETVPAAMPPAQAAPEPIPAEPTQPPASAKPAAAEPAPANAAPASATSRPPAPEAAKVDKKAAPSAPVLEKPKPKPVQKPEAKPEVKPEPKPALKPDQPFATQGYFLQIGAFGSEANARQLLEKASAAGFKATMTGTNGQFRVRVGPLPQHERALEMQARLKAKGFSPVLLGP